MPSPTFTTLVKEVGAFIDAKKADEIIQRQFKHCGATADNFSAANLKTIRAQVLGALSLYVPDPVQRNKVGAIIDKLAA
jgi:hypothetical protein